MTYEEFKTTTFSDLRMMYNTEKTETAILQLMEDMLPQESMKLTWSVFYITFLHFVVYTTWCCFALNIFYLNEVKVDYVVVFIVLVSGYLLEKIFREFLKNVYNANDTWVSVINKVHYHFFIAAGSCLVVRLIML